MRISLLLCVVLLGAACRHRDPYEQIAPSPTAMTERSVDTVDVFTTKTPERHYREVGILNGRIGQSGEVQHSRGMRVLAAKHGCDGLIIISNVRGVCIMYDGPASSGGEATGQPADGAASEVKLVEKDGKRSLRVHIEQGGVVFLWQATPKTDDRKVLLGLRSPVMNHCEPRIMVNGAVLPEVQTKLDTRTDTPTQWMKIAYADLYRIARGPRVVVRACEVEVRPTDQHLASIREFVMRLFEELSWNGSREAEDTLDDAAAAPADADKSAPSPSNTAATPVEL